MTKYKLLIILLLGIGWANHPLFGQQAISCESDQPITQGDILFNYGGATSTFNFTNRSTYSIGQPYITNSLSQKNISEGGFWALYLLPPQAPYVDATQGDFPDRIEISWTPEPISSEPSLGFKILRDGSFLAEVDAKTFQFVDFFVQSGEYYEYSIIGISPAGEGAPGKSVGFVNPNGIVTGRVVTNSGNPVPGAVVTLTPSFSNSLAFDGIDQDVCMNYADSLPTDMFSLSTWVKIGASHDSDGIIDFGSSFHKNYWIHTTAAGQGKGVVVGIGDGTNDYTVTHEFADKPDDWHHVAMVYGGGALILYIDGNFIGTAMGAIANEASLFKVGSRMDGAGFFEGWIDDMRIYNRLLSQTDIITTKDITESKFTEGLVAYFKFDEGIGQKIFDLSFNKLSGILNGATFSEDSPSIKNGGVSNSGGFYAIEGVNYSQEQTFTASPAKNFYDNYALEFNAAYQASAPLTNFDLPDTATVEITVHPFELTMRQSILSKMEGGIVAFELYIENSKFYLTLNGETKELGAAEAEYRRLAFAINPDTDQVLYYQDGELVRIVAFANVTGDWNNEAWQLGAKGIDSPSDFYIGLVDEVVFYKAALEIATLQLNASMSEAGGTDVGNGNLLSYFSLNEGEADTLYDYGAAMTGKSAFKNAVYSIITRRNETTPHEFEPNNRIINLNESGTAVDQVDFRDISTVPISGVVRFSNTFCFQDSIEILVDGKSYFPPIITDKDGKYTADFEPGASVILTPKFENHKFSPAFFEWRKLNVPLSGILFQNQTKRTIEGQMAGGNCLLSVIPESAIVKVKVRALNDCYEQEITLSDPEGKFEFKNLPPVPMAVSVIEHSNSAIKTFFQDKGGVETDLREIEKDTIDFIYFSTPNVDIEPFDSLECGGEKQLAFIQQSSPKNGYKEYRKEIQVYEEYTGGRCYLDTFSLTIDNDIADAEQYEVTSDSSVYVLNYFAGLPNIATNPTNPNLSHTKFLQVTAEVNGTPATAIDRVVVLGERSKEASFTTNSPEKPIFILRDPPGDASFATLTKGSTHCETWSSGKLSSITNNKSVDVDLGTKITTYAGSPVFGMITESEQIANVTTSGSFGAIESSENAIETCFTAEQTVSTSAGDDVMFGDGDVYVGASMNFEFGATDILNYDYENCELKLDNNIRVFPKEFATQFFYSEWQIETDVIPDLIAAGKTKEAEEWRAVVAENQRLKDNAKFIENVSFDGLVEITRSQTTEKVSSSSFTTEINWTVEMNNKLGFEIFDVGTTVEMGFEKEGNSTKTSGVSVAESRTVTYTLADDDPNDNYTLDILDDPVYGTPVFKLRSGESMCPWQPGTLNREEPGFTVDQKKIINVLENDVAIFNLTLSNLGQTAKDPLVYILGGIPNANPNGAQLQVDGEVLIQPLSFQLQPNESINLTLAIARGPEAFSYDSLGIFMASECEWERSRSLGFDASKDQDLDGDGGIDYEASKFYKAIYLDVDYIEPCSPIEISSPQQGWVVTPDDNKQLSITLDEFEKDDPDLKLIRVQYRPVNGDGSWINITEILKEDLPTTDPFKIISWDMGILDLKDGEYEIRAITECNNTALEKGRSTIIQGRKESDAPELFGQPQPADGVLVEGDEISITFTKRINCDKVFAASSKKLNNIGLYDTQTGRLVGFTHTCVDDKIIIVPNQSEDPFIENRVLRVEIDGIEDLYGNATGRLFDAPNKFEFIVNQSALNWEGLAIEEGTEIGNSITVTREISNQGAFIANYTIDDIPSWMIVNPSEGQIRPGERIEVSFTFPNNLTIDDYSTTLILNTTEGDEPLEVMLRVRCPSPDWVFDRVNEFENTQNFTLQVDIFDEMSEDPTDMVGAFINGELRGVTNIQYIRPLDKYIAFLTVYGDEGPEVPIDLRIWDASNCTVYPETVEKFNYIQGEIIGRLDEPQVLHVENVVERKIPLSAGWNWISVNVDLIDNSVTNVMNSARNPQGAFVKDNASFSEYVPAADVWAGGLENITYAPRYMYFSENKDSLCLEGAPYPPNSSPIDIKKGWNWIGFVPQLGTSVDRALESLNPLNGDLIKSQTQFAQYIAGFGWLGDLNFMEPPKGYLLNISQPGTLEYPDVDVAESFAAGRTKDKSPWEIESALFQHSMNTVAIIKGIDGLKEGDEIGAFTGGELRGKGKAIYIEPMNAYMAFITSYANQDGEELSFAYFDATKSEIVELNETLPFNADDRVGRVTDPFIFTVGEATEEVAVLTATNDLSNLDGLTVYPNPAQDQVFISFSMKATAEMQIQVTDMLGRVLEQQEVTVAVGVSTLRWNTNQLENGLYFLRFRNETGERTKKIMISRK